MMFLWTQCFVIYLRKSWVFPRGNCILFSKGGFTLLKDSLLFLTKAWRGYFPLRHCQIEYPQKSPKPKCNIKSLGYCHTLSFSSETTFFSPTASAAVL